MSGSALREKMSNSNIVTSLTDRQYNISIGFTLAYGCILSALLATTMSAKLEGISPWVFCLLYLILGFVGQAIAISSNNAIITFLAYNLVVAPTGLLLSTFVCYYTHADITMSLITVATIVVVMTTLATIFPQIFERMGRGLFVSLILGIVMELVSMLLGYGGQLFDWFFVVIFTLYVGYDWGLAQNYPKTINNAVRSSIALYLDIINLFVRLLSIFGSKNND